MRTSRPLARGAALQWQQFTALTRRHLLIRRRAWKTNVLLVLQAVLFILLIWAVDKAVSASRQRQPAFSSVPVAVPQPVAAVPLCSSNRFMRHGQPCYTFLYAPAVRPPAAATGLPMHTVFQSAAPHTAWPAFHFSGPLPLPLLPQGDPTVEAVVRGVMAGNAPPIPPQQVLAFANASHIDPWLLRHPETVRTCCRQPEVPANDGRECLTGARHRPCTP